MRVFYISTCSARLLERAVTLFQYGYTKMRVLVLCLVGFSALIMADTVSTDDNNFGASRRLKRGWIKDTAELAGKAGKFVARRWRVFKVKRLLLRDAQMAGKRRVRGRFFYTKNGGINRAEEDFFLSFPDKTVKMREGAALVMHGEIENYFLRFQHPVFDEEIRDLRKVCKQCEGKNVAGVIRIIKANAAKDGLADIPTYIYYLE